MTDFLQAALEYLERGWSVVPLQPRGKKPLVNWVRYQQQKPTEQEVRSWWEENPNANVGVVTGKVSGLVVVDVDTYKGGDAETIYNEYSTNLIARTGGGGFHLFYEYPEKADLVPNQVNEERGVDVRADGGLVVAPPSVHATGKRYFWTTTGQPGSTPHNVLEQKSREKDREQEESWLAHLIATGVREGGRNNALARLVGYLCGKGLPEDVARAFLVDWNKKLSKPLPRSEFERTVESVYSTHARRLTSLTQTEVARSPSEFVGDAGFRLLPLEPFLSEFSSTQVEWQVEEWLPKSTIAFAVSPPGSYKTWLELDLAVSVATGFPFLGHYKVNSPGPVVVVQQEDWHGQTADRLGVILRRKLELQVEKTETDSWEVDLPQQVPIFVHPDRALRFDDKKGLAAFAKSLRAVRPRLVIIDPLYSAASTDDFMAKAAEQMFVLKDLRDQIGCSFFLAHHKKKGAEGNEREGLWGSQFLNAFLETGWQIQKKTETKIKVKRHFKSEGAVPQLKVEFGINTHFPFSYDVQCTETGDDDEDEEEKEAAISDNELLSFFLSAHENGTEALSKKNVVASFGSQKTVERKLKQFVDEGKLIRVGKGVATKYKAVRTT